MQRLGLNKGAYYGERIDIDVILRDCLASARHHGWRLETLIEAPDHTLTALHRPAATPGRERRPFRVYLSAGIHGDEPAGPVAVRQLLAEDAWPSDAELWLCPCLNPTGFPHGRRENARGIDLNRQYRQPAEPETRAHVEWLARQPDFDLCLCLHEDWESHGFYLYELNPDHRPSLAESIIQAVAKVCPIDLSEEIEERPARGGVIRPELDPTKRPLWPEAFYLIRHKTRLSYTLEAPSDYPLSMRVQALVTAVNTALAIGCTAKEKPGTDKREAIT
jgi:murein peptide amidase A